MELLDKLGLGGWQILFYAINFVVLVIILRLLLFKPVKKIIDARRDKINSVISENEKLTTQANTIKDEYNTKLDNMKEDFIRSSAETTELAQTQANEIIETAKKSANDILENARVEAVAERARLQNELSSAIGNISIDMASKILKREVKESDNKAIINDCLSEWE